MKNVIILSTALISFNSISADITFNWLGSTSDQNSALSGTCDYLKSNNDMTCNLRQISVRKKLSQEDAKKISMRRYWNWTHISKRKRPMNT